MGFVDELMKRKKEEEVLLSRLKKRIPEYNELPRGKLKVMSRKGKYLYYFKESGKEKYSYIPVDKKSFVRSIVQRDYDEKLIKILEKDCKNLDRILNLYMDPVKNSVYNSLPAGRKVLVDPNFVTDEMFISNWYRDHPGGKNRYPDAKKFETDREEFVRSKSEKMIADMFNRLGVPYQYEPELVFKDGSRIYPDFVTLNVREHKTVYWEHFGMTSREDYAVKSHEKIQKYAQNGIYLGDKLIISEESERYSIDMQIIKALINRFLL